MRAWLAMLCWALAVVIGCSAPDDVTPASNDAGTDTGTRADTSVVVDARSATSLVLEPAEIVLCSATATLRAYATYEDGTRPEVTDRAEWTSSDPSVAGVTAGAITRGAKSGGAIVTARFEERIASTIVRNAECRFTITPAIVMVSIGATRAFNASWTVDGKTIEDLTKGSTWTSGDEGVATIDASGVARAVGKGTTTITATRGTSTAIATFAVSDAFVEEVVVTPKSLVLRAGGTPLPYVATAKMSDGTSVDVSKSAWWSVFDTKIAKAGEGGLVQGLAVGTTKVFASIADKTGGADVVVTTCDATGFAFSPPTLSLAKGLTGTFVAQATYCDGSTSNVGSAAVWSSSDPSIVSVDGGVVTTKAVGTAGITAKWGSFVASGGVTVGPAAIVLFQLTPASALAWNDERKLFTTHVELTDGSKMDVTSSSAFSSKSSEIEIDENMVWFRASGGTSSATIDATYGGLERSVFLNHMSCTSITGVEIIPTGLSPLPIGAAVDLRAVASFSCGSSSDVTATVAWSSSASSIASIGTSGIVLAESEGTASIKSTLAGAFSMGTRVVTVKPASVKLVSIAVTPVLAGAATIGASRKYGATGTYSDGSTAPIGSSPYTTWDLVDASNTPVGDTTATSTGRGSLTAKGSTKDLTGGVLYVRARQSGLEGRTALTITDAKVTSVRVTCATTDEIVAAGKLSCLPASFDLPVRCTAIATFADGKTSDVTVQATWATSDAAVLKDESRGAFVVKRRGKAIVSATFGGTASWTTGASEPTFPDQQAVVTVGFRLPTSLTIIGVPLKVGADERFSIRATFGVAKGCPTSGGPELAGASFDVSTLVRFTSSTSSIYIYPSINGPRVAAMSTGTGKLSATFHWLDTSVDTAVAP